MTEIAFWHSGAVQPPNTYSGQMPTHISVDHDTRIPSDRRETDQFDSQIGLT